MRLFNKVAFSVAAGLLFIFNFLFFIDFVKAEDMGSCQYVVEGESFCEASVQKDVCDTFSGAWEASGKCPAAPETGSSPSGSGSTGETVELENPFSVEADPSAIIGLIIKSLLGVVGGLALVMTVYGGFQWLTSAGNPEKVKSGSMTMLWSIIGLVVVLSSYLLVDTFLQYLAGTAK